MKVFVIAGEASGDLIGCYLIQSLQRQFLNVSITGIGGPLMQKQGQFDTLFPFDFLSEMGFTRILKKIFFFKGLIQKTIQAIYKTRPDLVISIDSPEFSLRVTKKVMKDFFCIHTPPPTVWAWRKGRAKTIPFKTHALFSLFPFEPAYFKNIPCYFIGHPVTKNMKGCKETFFKDFPNLDATAPVLCLLFGSRNYERETFAPIFCKAAQILQTLLPKLNVIGIGLHKPPIFQENWLWLSGTCSFQKNQAFAATTAALAASGTVTLELAYQSTPMVIAYKAPFFTSLVIKMLLKTKFIGLPNILAQRFIVPECLQKDCTPCVLVEKLLPLLKKENAYEKQKEELLKVADSLMCGQSFENALDQTFQEVFKLKKTLHTHKTTEPSDCAK